MRGPALRTDAPSAEDPAAAGAVPTSLDFFAAFFGTLVAGGVPVPIHPPARRSQLEEYLRRQSSILRARDVGRGPTRGLVPARPAGADRIGGASARYLYAPGAFAFGAYAWTLLAAIAVVAMVLLPAPG
jgi:hypothetical protein